MVMRCSTSLQLKRALCLVAAFAVLLPSAISAPSNDDPDEGYYDSSSTDDEPMEMAPQAIIGMLLLFFGGVGGIMFNLFMIVPTIAIGREDDRIRSGIRSIAASAPLGLFGVAVFVLSLVPLCYEVGEYIAFFEYPILSLQNIFFSIIGLAIVITGFVSNFVFLTGDGADDDGCCGVMFAAVAKRRTMCVSAIVVPTCLFYIFLALLAGGIYSGEEIIVWENNESVTFTTTFAEFFFGTVQGPMKLALTIIMLLGFVIALSAYSINVCFLSGTRTKVRNPLLRVQSLPLPSDVLEGFLSAVPKKVFHSTKPLAGFTDSGFTLPITHWRNANRDNLRIRVREIEEDFPVCEITVVYNLHSQDEATRQRESEWWECSREYYEKTHHLNRYDVVGEVSFDDVKEESTKREFTFYSGSVPWYVTPFYYYVASFLGLGWYYRHKVQQLFHKERLCVEKIYEVDTDVPLPWIDPETMKQTPDIPDVQELRELSQAELQKIKPTDKVYEMVVEEDAETLEDGSIRWVQTGKSLRARNGWQVIAEHVKERQKEENKRKNEPVDDFVVPVFLPPTASTMMQQEGDGQNEGSSIRYY